MSTATAAPPAHEHAKWTREYQEFQNNPPAAGVILKPIGTDERACLNVELKEGSEPFIYARAYVPCVVGEPVGWFLQSMEKADTYGLKCILMPKARDELIRKLGLDNLQIGVKALRVVRPSKSGASLLCEITEY